MAFSSAVPPDDCLFVLGEKWPSINSGQKALRSRLAPELDQSGGVVRSSAECLLLLQQPATVLVSRGGTKVIPGPLGKAGGATGRRPTQVCSEGTSKSTLANRPPDTSTRGLRGNPLAISCPLQASSGFLLAPFCILDETINLLGSVGKISISNLPLRDHTNSFPNNTDHCSECGGPDTEVTRILPQQLTGTSSGATVKGAILMCDGSQTKCHGVRYQRESTCGSRMI